MSTDITTAVPAPPAGPSAMQRLLGLNLVRSLLVSLGVLVVGVLLLESTDAYTNTQLSSLTYFTIAAIGLTALTGLNGQISLGHGALMAVGAYTTALMLDTDSPLPFPVIALAAIVMTSLVGFVVGIGAARLHGPYLAGATLAFAVALPSVALYFKGTFNGEAGLTVISPRPPEWFVSFIDAVSGEFATSSKYVAYLGLFCLVIALFFALNLGRSKIGRHWRAVRDQEVAAEIAGINLGRTRVQAFVISAAYAGLAGAVMAMVVRLAAPTVFTLVLSLSLLTAVVIGGLGSITGAFIGSAVLVFLPPLVTDLSTDAKLSDTQAAQMSPLIYGIVLVLVMLLAPGGVMGTLSMAWRRRRARRQLTATPTKKG
ncbi:MULTISPECIES: branched-chain amino acid ABC transporter permease [Mumia]|uniref:Branched-chain amino acid ABC transporter permease n=2 Tax=Mumia TaxID=1546255 RepID=A0ABW1QP19_9ACTN|nr:MULTISPECIES: branched-chain amino acid ABC transporter permease [Mumia]